MDVAIIKLSNKSKLVFASFKNIDLEVENYVVYDIDKTINIGKVIQIQKNSKKEYEAEIIRIASKKDVENNLKNIEEANYALKKCEKLIKKYELDMKLIDAVYTLDKKQLVFQFTSENRVDFRELAKELASIYKTRIELRQIGVRDKAKCVGGIGICGKELCCSQYLHEMDTVSINMAKNQKLALTPSKINGACGRLLCCLKYEDKQYSMLKKGLPLVGNEVETEFGKGIVESVDICNRKYKVSVPSHGIIELKLELESKNESNT